MENKFLKGAVILSISMFLTKLLGIIYILPFQRLVGESGMALYSYAYIPYSIFINLSTLGIPVGMAKFISKYNALGEYDTSRKIFRDSTVVMFVLGALGFLILRFISPWYASYILAGETELSNSVEDVTMAIRTISYALLIIPALSIFRGFFQGNQDMVPTSVSQFMEQLVRVLFILIGSYFIIVRGGSIEEAVSFSVFSAFISGLFAFAILYYYWLKNKKQFDELLKTTVPHQKRTTGKLFTELISYAIPFAVLGLATSLFQFVDTMTFNRYMIHGAGINKVLSEQIFGIYGGTLNKIIMIPVSFAIAFGQPLVPELMKHHVSGNKEGVKKYLISALHLTLFITLPTIIGMFLLAHPIYMFFGATSLELREIGGQIFQVGAFLGLFMALYSILTSILQGIGKQLYGILFLMIALIIKYIGNGIFIPRMGVNGAILSTMIAYTFSIVFSLIVIQKQTGFKFKNLLNQLVKIISITGIMGIVVFLLKMSLNHLFDYHASYLFAFIYVSVIGIIGATLYFFLAWKFGLIEALFGKKVTLKNITARFSRKK